MKWILILFFLLMFPLTSALLDSETQTNTNPNEGFLIDYPKFSIVENNQSFNLSIFVYNISDGLEVTTANCNLKIYNHTGEMVLNRNLSYVGENYNLFLSSGNFTQNDIFNFNIYCSNANLGGFASGIFEVTPTGIDPSKTRSDSLARGIWVFFILSILLFMAFFFTSSKLQIKWTYFLLGFMAFLPVINFIFIDIQDQVINPNVENFFSFFTTASFILFWFAFGLIAIMWGLTFFQTLMFKHARMKLEKYG